MSIKEFPDVPKIIWQTHNYKYEDLSDHLKKATRTWINLNPGWEYRYVNDQERDQWILKNYPNLYQSYMKVQHPKIVTEHFQPYNRGMMQADIWRMLVTYEYGGVYADMDSYCKTPIDYALKDIEGDYDSFVENPFLDPNGTLSINNANFTVIKNSNTLKDAMDNTFNEIFISINQDNVSNWLTPHDSFGQSMLNSKTSNKNFRISYHSKDFKDSFQYLDVDYYGQKINYKELLKELNLEV